MDTKNYTQVLIDGKIYMLGGSEDEGYLQRTASYVNEKIAEVRKFPGFLKQSDDYQEAMIELNLADDYFKAQERADTMERLRNDMEKETYSLKHELVSTQMKLEAVLKDLEERQRQMSSFLSRSQRQACGMRSEALLAQGSPMRSLPGGLWSQQEKQIPIRDIDRNRGNVLWICVGHSFLSNPPEGGEMERTWKKETWSF